MKHGSLNHRSKFDSQLKALDTFIFGDTVVIHHQQQTQPSPGSQWWPSMNIYNIKNFHRSDFPLVFGTRMYLISRVSAMLMKSSSHHGISTLSNVLSGNNPVYLNKQPHCPLSILAKQVYQFKPSALSTGSNGKYKYDALLWHHFVVGEDLEKWSGGRNKNSRISWLQWAKHAKVCSDLLWVLMRELLIAPEFSAKETLLSASAGPIHRHNVCSLGISDYVAVLIITH